LLVVMKHFFLNEKEEAEKLLGRIQEEYPQAAAMCYFSGFMARLNGKLENAKKFFEEVQRMVPKNEKMVASMNYQIGYSNFLLNDWESVIVHVEKFLARPVKESIDKSMRPYAAYVIGFSYWMVTPKDSVNLKTVNDKILNLYNSAKDWVRPDESYDKYAKRKMTEFSQKKEFDTFDELFISADAHREGKQFEKCEEKLQQLYQYIEKPEFSTKRDYFAGYFYLKGSCLLGLKKYEEAEAFLKRSIAEDGKIAKETWLVPFAWMVLADMAMELKKWAEAEKYLDKLKDFKDYDWERIVAIRAYGHRQTLIKYLPKKK